LVALTSANRFHSSQENFSTNEIGGRGDPVTWYAKKHNRPKVNLSHPQYTVQRPENSPEKNTKQEPKVPFEEPKIRNQVKIFARSLEVKLPTVKSRAGQRQREEKD